MKVSATAVLATALSCGSSLADEPPTTLTYYEVRGNSAPALRAQLKMLGSRDPITQRRFDGRVDWSLQWSYRADRTAGGCELASFDVTVETRMMLPRWTPPASAAPGLRKEWNRYSATLRQHEDGHIDIARASAQALRGRLTEKLARKSLSIACTQMRRELDAIGHRAVADGRRRDRAYDLATRHGEIQGARLPE